MWVLRGLFGIGLATSLAFLMSMPVQAAERADGKTQRYVVTYRSAQAARRQQMPDGHSRSIVRRLERHKAAAMRMSPEAAAALAQDPSVESVEPDPQRYPVSMMRALPSGADTPAAAGTQGTQVVPYGRRMIQAGGYAGVPASGIKVCVIDSGYDLGHEDKPGSNLVTGSNDPTGAGPWREDGDGHGSHVSGTINARNNSLGIVGVYPGVPMHVVRVFDSSGSWMYSSDLVAALDRCTDAGARVVNMSLGGGSPSSVERIAFNNAYAMGVLSFAAAGNDGNTTLTYPASYGSVVSVAAVDPDARSAGFSNHNAQVELAAPGVSVLSTVPRGSVANAMLLSGLGAVAVEPMDNFPIPGTPVSGPLIDCGLAASAAECGDATGAVCLAERGTVTFAQKAQSCQAAGGIAAIVFNSSGQTGPVSGTLGETHVDIPIVGIDRSTGLALRAEYLGSPATLDFSSTAYDYDYYSGTSMATPHAAGAAALLWSRHPGCSAADIRSALAAGALDLGVPGRDAYYGFGLIKVRAASTYLDSLACGSPSL